MVSLTRVWVSSAQSQEFPLTVSMLLDVLDVIAPFKHFSKLKQFVECKLPPGFPVKLGECLVSVCGDVVLVSLSLRHQVVIVFFCLV